MQITCSWNGEVATRNIDRVRRARRCSWHRPACFLALVCMCATCSYDHDEMAGMLTSEKEISEVFMNGQRDKKGQKSTKSEGQSGKDASGVTFWSVPGQCSLQTTADSGGLAYFARALISPRRN